MRQSLLPAVPLALLLLGGCTMISNELETAVSEDTHQASLTRKVDEHATPEQRRAKVNAYLWRAALDTVGYLPLVTSDHLRGRIVTDWYSAPSLPDERTQMMVEVLHAELRRDALRVSIVREVRRADGWEAAPAPSAAVAALEETIVAKARELRGG